MRSFYFWLIVVILFLFFGFGFWYLFNNRLVWFGGSVKNDYKTVDCNLKIGVEADICKFINLQFPYSGDEVNKKMLTKSSVKITKFGLVGLSIVEGFLFDYVEKDESILMLVGFDAKDNRRFVTTIKIPLYAIIDETSRINFYFYKVKDKLLNSKREEFKLKDSTSITRELSKFKNLPVVFMLMDNHVSDKNMVKARENKVELRLMNEINNQVDATRTLLGKVNGNHLTSEYGDYNKNLIIIDDYSVFEKIDVNQIPITFNVIVNDEQ